MSAICKQYFLFILESRYISQRVRYLKTRILGVQMQSKLSPFKGGERRMNNEYHVVKYLFHLFRKQTYINHIFEYHRLSQSVE